MKKLIITFCLSAFLFQSCNDLLEEKNKTNAVSTYFDSQAGFEDALKGAYSQMRSFYATERGMSMTVFGTDTYTQGSDGSWKSFNQYSTDLNPASGIIRELWTDFYRGINTTNTVIDRADNVPNLDPAIKTTRVAEARFLRAHFYFILVQLFGEVHLSLHESAAPSTEASRATVAEVYNQIIGDLDFAIANLPDKQANWGRATKPAAQHLLARVHLTRATSDATINASDEYQKAADLANSVINNYTFKLLPDYAKVFEQGAGEINDEVIWSVQYTNDPLTNGTGNNAHVFFLMEYDVQPGMQRDVFNGRPFKRFKPTNYTLALWDRSMDSRYKKNFKDVFYANKPGTYNINVLDDPSTPDDKTVVTKSVTLNSGDTAIWLPGYEVDFTSQVAKKYQVISPSEYTEKLYPSLTKFLDPMRANLGVFEGSRDFLAFRLAETYLIRAEALMYLNQKDEAATMLNAVRRRAAFPGKEMEMEISADDVTLEFILDERARELLGEQFRWFDLKRTNTLLERVKIHNPQAKENIRDYHILRPIPQDQIDRTVNSNGASFGQNFGY